MGLESSRLKNNDTHSSRLQLLKCSLQIIRDRILVLCIVVLRCVSYEWKRGAKVVVVVMVVVFLYSSEDDR